MTLPPDPFGRVRGFDRVDRVRMLREAGHALIDLGSPAAVFAGSGILAWLSGEVADLVRDAWQVAAPRGSHAKPQALARRLMADDEREGKRQAQCDIDNDENLS